MGGIDDIKKEDFDHERKVMELIYAWVKELFSGFRLLYICLFFLIVGITFLSLEIKNIKNIIPFPMSSIFYGVGFGFVTGILTIWDFSRHIVGKLHYKTPLSLTEIMYFVIIGFLISYIWMFTQMTLKTEFYKYIFFRILLLFQLVHLLALFGLSIMKKFMEKYILYERKKVDLSTHSSSS